MLINTNHGLPNPGESQTHESLPGGTIVQLGHRGHLLPSGVEGGEEPDDANALADLRGFDVAEIECYGERNVDYEVGGLI